MRVIEELKLSSYFVGLANQWVPSSPRFTDKTKGASLAPEKFGSVNDLAHVMAPLKVPSRFVITVHDKGTCPENFSL